MKTDSRSRQPAVFAGILFALCAAAEEQQTQIKLDPAKTRIEWTLGDVLHTVQGTFSAEVRHHFVRSSNG